MSRPVTAWLPKHVYMSGTNKSFVVSMSHQGKALYFGTFASLTQAVKVAKYARRALGKEAV